MVHVYETATGKEKGGNDVIPRADGGTAGGSLAGPPMVRGSITPAIREGGNAPPPTWTSTCRSITTPSASDVAKDQYIIGKDFVRIAEVVLETDPSGRWLLVSVQNGDGGEFEHHLRNPKGTWSKLDGFKDQIVEGNFGDGQLLLVSRRLGPARQGPEADAQGRRRDIHRQGRGRNHPAGPGFHRHRLLRQRRDRRRDVEDLCALPGGRAQRAAHVRLLRQAGGAGPAASGLVRR